MVTITGDSEVYSDTVMTVSAMSPQVLYTTACCSLEATGDGSFIPLQVNYTERFSAAGKTR